MGGSGGYRGFGYHSLGATLNIVRRPNVDSQVQTLQRQLVRLGFLADTSGSTGVDGRWGPLTALATENAARYVGWSGAAFSPASARTATSGTVEVPDDLLARIAAAAPAPASTPGAVPGVAPADQAVVPIVIGPHLDLPQQEPATDDGGSWIVPVGISAGVLVVGAMIALAMTAKGPPKKRPVAANRRRRYRRRTRR
jgi:hypothetical protein